MPKRNNGEGSLQRPPVPRTTTWIDSRAKLVLNTRVENDQYGVALLAPDGSWTNIDWGLTLPMAYRFLKVLRANGTYDHASYTTGRDISK